MKLEFLRKILEMSCHTQTTKFHIKWEKMMIRVYFILVAICGFNMRMTVTSISTVVYSWHRVRSSSVLLQITQAGQLVTYCVSRVPTAAGIKGNNIAVIRLELHLMAKIK